MTCFILLVKYYYYDVKEKEKKTFRMWLYVGTCV